MTEPTAAAPSACRHELLAWLDAHAQWPLAGRIDGPAGLLAEMRGHLNVTGDHYSIVADDIGALRFTVPDQITAVAINGARSASFTRTDLPATLTLTVEPETADDGWLGSAWRTPWPLGRPGGR